MTKRFLIFFFIAFFLKSYSQQRSIDSLELFLHNYKKVDSHYVNLRLTYITQKIFSSLDSTMLDYSKETLKIASQIDYKQGIVSAYEKIAITYQYAYSNPIKEYPFL